MCRVLISATVQDALEWLEINQERSYEEIVASLGTTGNDDNDPNAEPASLQACEQARSLVCNECGKKFRSQAQAEFHASKTQHVDFAESEEEIAPLTHEEKKARLEELRQKLAEKRSGMSEQDKIDKKRNEVSKSRSSDLIFIVADQSPGDPTKKYEGNTGYQRRSRKKKQLKEAATKRKEKQEEVEAKARIKAKIAADREQRRLKAEKDKAEREGRAAPAFAVTAPTASTTLSPEGSKPASGYTEARLRLQTSRGNLQKTFPVTTTLYEVAAALTQQTGYEVQSFTQNFPKKTFDTVDFGASLKELGLVPSASLVVQ